MHNLPIFAIGKGSKKHFWGQSHDNYSKRDGAEPWIANDMLGLGYQFVDNEINLQHGASCIRETQSKNHTTRPFGHLFIELPAAIVNIL